MLVFALPTGLDAYSQAVTNARTALSNVNGEGKTLATLVDSDAPTLSTQGRVTRYFMGFEGDRSLDAATVVEQTRTGLMRYTLGLRLASGTEQWIALMAPPGGLRIEMRDMTGDHVPNDLVVTPALFDWPLAVLLKDSRDHFSVAISAVFPGSLGSGRNQASKARDVQCAALLITSGFKARSRTNGRGLFPPHPQENVSFAIAQTATTRLASSSSFGRSPPALITI